MARGGPPKAMKARRPAALESIIWTASSGEQVSKLVMQGTIVQVNVSPGGVPKRAVARGFITPLGIEGDLHAHPNIHGGPRKAVLLIAAETIEIGRAHV